MTGSRAGGLGRMPSQPAGSTALSRSGSGAAKPPQRGADLDGLVARDGKKSEMKPEAGEANGQGRVAARDKNSAREVRWVPPRLTESEKLAEVPERRDQKPQAFNLAVKGAEPELDQKERALKLGTQTLAQSKDGQQVRRSQGEPRQGPLRPRREQSQTRCAGP